MADVGRKQGSEIVKGDLTRPWAPAGLIKENIAIYRRLHVFSQTGKNEDFAKAVENSLIIRKSSKPGWHRPLRPSEGADKGAQTHQV